MTLEEELDLELHLEISTGQFRREFRETESLRVQLNDFVNDGTTDVLEKRETHVCHTVLFIILFTDLLLCSFYYFVPVSLITLCKTSPSIFNVTQINVLSFCIFN